MSEPTPRRKNSIFGFFHKSGSQSASTTPRSSTSYPSLRLGKSASKKEATIDPMKIALVVDLEVDCLIQLHENFKSSKVRLLAAQVIEGFSEVTNENGGRSIRLSNSGWLSLSELCTAFDEESIQTASTLALAVLGSNWDYHDDIVRYIGFRTLIQLANTDRINVQLNILNLIGSLALNENYRGNISNEVLETIIFAGFTTTTVKVQTAVATILSNLSLDENDARKICAEGGIELLSSLLKDDAGTALVVGIMNTITNITLTDDDKLKQQVSTKIGIEKLVRYLKLDSFQTPDVQKPILIAIANLTPIDSQAAHFVRLGIIGILKELSRSHDEDVVLGVVMTFNSLADNKRAVRALAKEDIWECLVEVANKIKSVMRGSRHNSSGELSPSSSSSSFGSGNGKGRTGSGTSLSSMRGRSASSNNYTMNWYNTSAILQEISSVLKKLDPILLVELPPDENKPATKDSIPPSPIIVTPPTESENTNSQNNVTINTQKSENQLLPPAIPRSDSHSSFSDEPIDSSLAILWESIDKKIQANPQQFIKLREISHMDGDQYTFAAKVAKITVPLLIELLVEVTVKGADINDIATLQHQVLDLILRLVNEADFGHAKLETSCITDLLDLLSGKDKRFTTITAYSGIKNSDVSAKVAQLMASMVTNNKLVGQLIIQAGGIVRLVYILKMSLVGSSASQNEAPYELILKSYAALILGLICNSNNENQNSILELGGFPGLLSLLDPSHLDEIKARGSLALSYLVKSNEKLQNHVRKVGGVIETLIQHLIMKDSDVKSNACLCLLELARDNDKNRSAICKSGGASLLVNILILSSFINDELLFNCTATIWVLANKKKRRKIFIESGAVDALENLSNVPSSKVVTAARQTSALLQKNFA